MKSLIIIFALLFFTSCKKTIPEPNPQILMEADLAFSDYSTKHGIQKAFIEFAHDSVVLLKPNKLPIEGLQSLVDSYSGINDSIGTLRWKPSKAFIAKSGEMGFTYGIWTYVATGDTTKGTYLTVWKKNDKGQWKYIADTGNEGIGK